jgi:ADP-heptose:LPS heptosyltransferase
MSGVAVFRALQLGDLLCMVPTLRALRAAFPEKEIALIGLPWAREFAGRFACYVDRFLEFPGHPALPERRDPQGRLDAFFEDARERHFDLALQLHGSGQVTNPLVAKLGAREMAGFAIPGERAPLGLYVDWRDREHEIDRGLRLLSALGIPDRGRTLEFPLEARDAEELEALESRHGFIAESAVCVHVGAQLSSRRWPPERFARVADRLAAAGLRVVLTGTAAEAPLTARVAGAMTHPAVDLAGRTSLGGAAALIAAARMLVCNDTGVSHLAAAFGTPSVVVCSGADPQRWAPLDHGRHRVLWHDVACRPCAHADCPIERPSPHPCAAGVSADAVSAQAKELLRCAG